MIQLKNISFSYTQVDKPSLSHINLIIRRGECILLYGKNGCGKTTMTRLLNGMVPDSYDGILDGQVQIKGLNPTDCSIYELSKVVGTVFQNPRTRLYTVNTTDEIALGCENRGLPPEEIQKRVMKAASDLHIETLLDRNIFKLSGGEKQKIAFASICALSPEICVLDEPSSNLDCFTVRELQSILELLKRQGETIVLAEHRARYLGRLVNRAVLLEEGEIVREYSMQELTDFPIQKRMEAEIRPIHLEEFTLSQRKPAPSSHTLSLQNIRFTYDKRKAPQIDYASFSTDRIVAVVGRNDAGKPTFASAVYEVLENKTGKICLGDTNVLPKKRLSIGYMIMREVNHQLFTDGVGKEVVLRIKEPSEERLCQVLLQMNIAALKNHHPMTLSGGQKQHVTIATAVFCDKKIFVLDEPTNGLNLSHMMQTAELLGRLKSPGRYIFVIAHDCEFILSACDEVIETENGVLKNNYLLDEKGPQTLQTFYFDGE